MSADTATAPKTVLVVDDDEDIRLSLRDLLVDHGYRVLLAANGEEGLACCESASAPDCVVLDLWMPVMDGWQLAKAMTESTFPPIPLVVVTAGEGIWRYPHSATHVMRKPVRPESLLVLVADAIARKRA
jgi:two-component system sensor histidine kinase/response regulator